MKIKFLQAYKEYKKGDIVDSFDDAKIIQQLKAKGIIQAVKMQRRYNDKMMRNYQNK